MKTPLLLRLAGAALIGCALLPSRAAEADPTDASRSLTWRPGVPVEVRVAPGRVTTILIRSERKVSAISLASPVLTYKYDKNLNQLEITPTVRGGGAETNLNLRIGPDVYVLLVKVVDDARAQVLLAFALDGDSGDDDEAALARTHPLAPEEVDIVGAARTMERAENDPVFRRAQADLRLEPLGRLYSWNGCLVELAEAAQFLSQDLLVFRVQWVNRTGDALYLDPAQYGLAVAGQAIPIIARYKVGVGSIVYPGQLETVYLAVQGYRLSRHNPWELALPPDGAAVARLLRLGP